MNALGGDSDKKLFFINVEGFKGQLEKFTSLKRRMQLSLSGTILKQSGGSAALAQPAIIQ